MTGSATGEERRMPGRKTLDTLRTLGIVLALIFLFGYFSLTIDGFSGWGNIQFMASQSVIVSLAAIGMTLIIISGGIDLSVGSVVALTMVMTAWWIDLLGAGFSLLLAVAAGVLTGALCGLLNGLVIAGYRLVPFIATLGMMGIARGAAKLIAGSQTINVEPEGWRQSWLYFLTLNPRVPGTQPLPGSASLPSWLLVSPGVWLLILLAVAMALVLYRTVFGRHVFAIGSNEAAARLCGVRVTRMKVIIYLVAGLFTGLAGVVSCSRQAQGDPTAHFGLELDVIAAVVIGGGSLTGGEGSILGSLVGAAIMVVLRFGLMQGNVPEPWLEIIIGLIIIHAVAIDQLLHPKSE